MTAVQEISLSDEVVRQVLVLELAKEYRELYRQMTDDICARQGEINDLAGEELTQAQNAMWDKSSAYHVWFRAIIDSVPEAHIQLFWQHT